MMLSCWRVSPKSRPLFDALAESFSKMLGPELTDRYIKLNEANLKANKNRFTSYNIDYANLLNSTASESTT